MDHISLHWCASENFSAPQVDLYRFWNHRQKNFCDEIATGISVHCLIYLSPHYSHASLQEVLEINISKLLLYLFFVCNTNNISVKSKAETPAEANHWNLHWRSKSYQYCNTSTRLYAAQLAVLAEVDNSQPTLGVADYCKEERLSQRMNNRSLPILAFISGREGKDSEFAIEGLDILSWFLQPALLMHSL